MRIVLAALWLGTLAACNGPESGNIATSGPNVLQITVNSGPTRRYENGAFTSVTICIPRGQSQCQTISGVLVDTGSSGLRILSSVLSLSLPHQTSSNSNPVAECVQFQDGYTWGPVELADIKLSGRAGQLGSYPDHRRAGFRERA